MILQIFKFNLAIISNFHEVDPALVSSALPPGSTAPELKARIHALPGTHESDDTIAVDVGK